MIRSFYRSGHPLGDRAALRNHRRRHARSRRGAYRKRGAAYRVPAPPAAPATSLARAPAVRRLGLLARGRSPDPGGVGLGRDAACWGWPGTVHGIVKPTPDLMISPIARCGSAQTHIRIDRVPRVVLPFPNARSAARRMTPAPAALDVKLWGALPASRAPSATSPRASARSWRKRLNQGTDQWRV